MKLLNIFNMVVTGVLVTVSIIEKDFTETAAWTLLLVNSIVIHVNNKLNNQ
jgi:hypothetical protein